MRNRTYVSFFSTQYRPSGRLWFAGLVLLCFAQVSAAQTLFIHSQQVNLLAEPRFGSDTITELVLGDEVESIQEQGLWLKIEYQGLTGWLNKFVAQPQAPIERVTVVPSEGANQLKDVRRRVSALTTAAAARGLAASDSDRDAVHPSNYQAVEYMESFVISLADLQVFRAQMTAKEAE